jgi:hypothetical protein
MGTVTLAAVATPATRTAAAVVSRRFLAMR